MRIIIRRKMYFVMYTSRLNYLRGRQRERSAISFYPVLPHLLHTHSLLFSYIRPPSLDGTQGSLKQEVLVSNPGQGNYLCDEHFTNNQVQKKSINLKYLI